MDIDNSILVTNKTGKPITLELLCAIEGTVLKSIALPSKLTSIMHIKDTEFFRVSPQGVTEEEALAAS